MTTMNFTKRVTSSLFMLGTICLLNWSTSDNQNHNQPLPLLLLHLVLIKLGKERHLVDVAKRLQTGETSPSPNRVGNRQHHCHYPHPPHHNHPEEADETSITYSWMMVWKNPSWPLLKVGKRNHTHHPQGQDHRPVDKLQAEVNVTNSTSNSSWKMSSGWKQTSTSCSASRTFRNT